MKFMMPFVFLIALFTLSSCEKSTEPVTINPFHDAFVEASKHLNIEEKALDYTATFPSYLKENGFIEPKTDNEKATLGRVLFYDKNLSRTKEVSCASCHLQEKAFADGKKVSDGVSGRQTTRNSIGLGSAVSIGSSYGSSNFFGIGFFWDDRAHSVVEQSRASFSNSSEMDMDIDLVVERVKENQAYYKWLFMEAYPEGIN
ncbi:MAG TPA: hypothetical protein ENK85_11575 [Saprospiraceae bacterium]|nr:hypothetical protein [Saprospiraceae bacterium]